MLSTQIQVIEPASPQWPPQLDSESFRALHVIGDVGLLAKPLLGIFCSSRCPGNVILKTYDAIRTIRDRQQAVAGGFHSPMEKECLDLLLRGDAPIVVVLARSLGKMRVPSDWKPLVDRGQMLIVSPFSGKHATTTGKRAEQRNHVVAELSRALFVPHAAAGSKTETLCEFWLQRAKNVFVLDAECAKLLGLGAQLFEDHWEPLVDA